MPRTISRYGWTPDLPDRRDYLYEAPRPMLRKLPPRTDMRILCPAVYNQGDLGSCTANAIAAAFEFELLRQNKKHDFMPSRLFIYYNERVIEHTAESDSGAQIRDGMKSVNKQGVCMEKEWPYDVQKFTQKPGESCYASALLHQVLSYHRVPRMLNQMKACLATGYPFVFGFTVYESFESPLVAKTGRVSMPKRDERPVGGHAVMAVGYDDRTKRFIVRNSWGPGWGMEGYFTIPYDYLTEENLSDDFWTIRMVEDR